MNTNILDFGAAADGKTLCTEAIQKAIDACHKSGGGRVVIPCGCFVSGTLWLRDNVELHLEHGAVLKGSTNMDDYNELDAFPQNFSSPNIEKWLGKHLIIALECENIAITGTGKIDGSGDFFLSEKSEYFGTFGWRDGFRSSRDDDLRRPGQLVFFVECRNITVENVTLFNMPCWGLVLYGCDYATVRGLKVFNPKDAANSDGIDIDCCSYVTVSDCLIDTGDDAIAVRGACARLKNNNKPCEYITISNCVLAASACAFRFGVGTGIIRHVRVSNITVPRAGLCLQFMTDYCGRGCVSMEDIHISGISTVNCGVPFAVYENSGASVRNVSVENMYAEGFSSFVIAPAHTDTISDITLRNIRYKLAPSGFITNPKDLAQRGDRVVTAKNVDGLCIENFSVEPQDDAMKDWSGLCDLTNCTNIIKKEVFLA